MGIYTSTTWTTGVTPCSQGNMNNIEKMLKKVAAVSLFGPYSITTTPTFFNHNLTDQNGIAIIPDFVIIQVSGTSINAYIVEVDFSTMTTTQAKLTATINSPTIYGVAMKF